ncbi:hypothetical protein V5799_018736 [Amblyomma americanum]|uniref:Secreted protein n=1 Tax=Amblyomma americanum TaxID=6943 RepID=A0AAQ4EYK5_AMBAM
MQGTALCVLQIFLAVFALHGTAVVEQLSGENTTYLGEEDGSFEYDGCAHNGVNNGTHFVPYHQVVRSTAPNPNRIVD